MIATPEEVCIESERLIVRPMNLADEKGMFEMDSDPEVHTWLGNRPVEHIEQSRDMILFIIQQYRDYGVGRWAIVEKGSGEFVGWTGFKFIAHTINGHAGYYDFGYRLAKRFWGKGYATEAGRASLHYGMETMDLKPVHAMTDINNFASRNVLEKLGFKYIETFKYDAEPNWREPGAPTTWYDWPHK